MPATEFKLKANKIPYINAEAKKDDQTERLPQSKS